MQKEKLSGSYVRYGVREHAMAAISNGLALHGGLRPYCGTFLVFSDYLRPALRLSALIGIPVIYVFTHDSIGTGEDGPTHQGVEQVMSLRAIPNLVVIRPADANETQYAWKEAITREDGPTALILTRQGLPSLTGKFKDVTRGGYIVVEESASEPQVILIGTGSELQYAIAAAPVLESEAFQLGWSACHPGSFLLQRLTSTERKFYRELSPLGLLLRQVHRWAGIDMRVT